MDRITIKELLVRCVLGGDDEERREMQDVLVTVTLHADLRKAGQSDRLEDAVDYRAVKKEVLAAAEGSRYRLIEALAERIAAPCPGHAGARRVAARAAPPSRSRARQRPRRSDRGGARPSAARPRPAVDTRRGRSADRSHRLAV